MNSCERTQEPRFYLCILILGGSQGRHVLTALSGREKAFVGHECVLESSVGMASFAGSQTSPSRRQDVAPRLSLDPLRVRVGLQVPTRDA